MDPTTSTTVQPPSSPPHTPPNAIFDLNNTNTNHHQHQQKNISRNMEHFKSLMLNLSRQLLPAQQSLVETRFDDVFTHELLVPDHPPYNDMILTALWELNSVGGNSSVEAISNFIEKEYRELPWAHSTILNRHLKDLCSKGKIYMTQDKCYHRTKPLPIYSPCDHLPSDDIPYLSPISSPSYSTSDGTCSSPTSSTSDSTCSSHSSSSTSFFWCPEGRRRKRIQVRDSGRGRGRGRGKGRGRPSKTLQVGQRDSSCGKIQAARRWGRPRKRDKIGEESQIDEDLVDVRVVEAKTNKLEEHAQVTTEDQNEVTRMEFDEDLVDVRVVDAKTNKLEEHTQVTTEDQNEVTRMEFEQGVIRDGAEKQQNQSEANNNAVVETWLSVEDDTDDSEEENLPCEQLTLGEKYRPQKGYRVRWIGRLEHIRGKAECVKHRGSGSRQHSHNEQHQPREQFVERTKEQDHQRKQCNVIWIGRRVQKLKEAARDPFEEQSDDDVTGPEDDLNDAEVDELVEQSRQKIESEETNAEHNLTEENRQSDFVEKHTFGDEKVTTVPCEGHDRVGMEPVLGVQMADTQDLVVMQCEAEIAIANVGKQLDDTVEGQNLREEQPKKGNEQEFQSHEQHTGGDAEQKILEKQVEMETAENTEAEEQVETKEQSGELRDNMPEELVYPQEQCVEMTEDSLQSSRKNQVKNGEAELVEERPRQEEQQTALTQKELDSEVQQDQYSYMIEEKNQPFIEKDGLQDQNNVASNENMGSSDSTIGWGVWRLKEAEKDPFDGQPDDDVTRLEVDLCDAQADEHVEQSKQEIEKEGTNAERTRTEENQQSEIVEKQILQKERVTSLIDDNNFPCEGTHQVWMQPILEVQMADEQASVIMQFDAEVAVTSVGKQVDDTVEEQIRPEEQPKVSDGKEFQTDELQKGGDSEQKILEKQVEIESAETTEAEEQNDYFTEEQVERIEHSSEQPQQEQQTKVNDKEVMLVVDSESQQEQGVEMSEDQNQACTQKDVLQDDRMGTEPVLEVQMADEQESMMQYEAQGAVASVETAEKTEAEGRDNNLNMEQEETKGQSDEHNCSDHKLQEEPRRPLRQGLRSSCKKEEATPNAKTQLEEVTPVRRVLRSYNTVPGAAEITEKVPDDSKEQPEHSERTRSSKRKLKIPEAEPVLNLRKTRRTGL